MKYLSTAKLGAYQQKWAGQLADFDFEIKYRPGKIITNADVLSRLSSDNVDILSECIYGSAIPLEIKSAQSSVIFIESTDVSIAETFPSYTSAELREMQSKDAVITKCMEFIKSKTLPKSSFVSKKNKRVQVLLRRLKNLDIIDGVIYRLVQDPKLGDITQICVC